jgi:hypothetical protein
LLDLADAAGRPLGEYLLDIAERVNFNLLAYRSALRAMLGYTSHGYIFHPVPLEDGRVAIAAIGSGYEGSGDPSVRSKRNEFGMDRLLGLHEALTVKTLDLDRDGQVGYFVECVLGGLHGLGVADLVAGLEPQPELHAEVAQRVGVVVAGEHDRFMRATSLDKASYLRAFGANPDSSLEPLLAASRARP